MISSLDAENKNKFLAYFQLVGNLHLVLDPSHFYRFFFLDVCVFGFQVFRFRNFCVVYIYFNKLYFYFYFMLEVVVN